MYFIEGHYLYTLDGSSGRGERTSERGATGAPERRAGTSEGTLTERARRALYWWRLLEKIASWIYVNLLYSSGALKINVKFARKF